MAGGGVAAGWFEDPWRQARLRWWDGAAWTGHTSDGLTAQASDSGTVLERLLGSADRLAVIDVETTGLYNADRVVEVAVVTIDRTGSVVDEFETLVNPTRDVGPTWLHQVTASMVTDAPTFEEVAHHVAARIDGAVCAAHNLPFDRRMLTNEFAKAGIDVGWGVGLDTLRVTGCKLGVACHEYDIHHANAHAAIHDARATAQLLLKLLDGFPAGCAPAIARPLDVTPMRIHTRTGSAAAHVPAPYLADLARGVHTAADVAPYVQLLDIAVGDLRLTDEERAALADLGADLGLDANRIARAHREFVNGLIDAALEDQIVTDDEHHQLCRAAALLGVDPDLVSRRTDDFRAKTDEVDITPGMTVCFTGAAVTSLGAEIPRSELMALAEAQQLCAVKSVTSGCDLLVAADPESRSGKAAKARHHGTPIASLHDFLQAIEAGTTLRVARLQSAGTALVCGRCGASWMATRKAARPTCGDCKPMRPADANLGATTEPPAVETLTCIECGSTWQRPRARGRKPSRCARC